MQVGTKLASKSYLSWLSWLSYLSLSCLTKPNVGRGKTRSGVGFLGAKATHKGIPPKRPSKTRCLRPTWPLDPFHKGLCKPIWALSALRGAILLVSQLQVLNQCFDVGRLVWFLGYSGVGRLVLAVPGIGHPADIGLFGQSDPTSPILWMQDLALRGVNRALANYQVVSPLAFTTIGLRANIIPTHWFVARVFFGHWPPRDTFPNASSDDQYRQRTSKQEGSGTGWQVLADCVLGVNGIHSAHNTGCRASI